MDRVLALIVGYSIGCIQIAYFLGKIKGVDIRKIGSGNLGATNTARALGKKAGISVFVLDILKGVLAFYICYIYLGNSSNIVFGVYGGLGAIMGHNFPFYLNFKGGKGIATSLGVLLCLDPLICILLFVTGILILILTKYMSLASVSMSFCLPFISFLLGYKGETLILLTILAILAIFQHRGNIKRLLNGQENKFYLTKKS